MHVVHVTPAFEPAWAHGDVPGQVACLARAQARRGHRVSVLTTDALAPHERVPHGIEEADGIRVIRVPNLSSSSYLWFGCTTPLGTRRAARRLLADDATVVHLHELVTIETLQVVPLVPVSTPVVVSTHRQLTDSRVSASLARLWTLAGGARVRRRVDLYVAASDEEADMLRGSGPTISPLAEAPVRVVPDGVDFSPFLDADRGHRAGDREGIRTLLVIGSVRNVSPVSTLMEAIATVGRDGTRVQVVIAGGDPSAGQPLRARGVSLDLMDSVSFTGYVPPSKLPCLLGAADLVGVVEPASRVSEVVLGALALGRPVIDAAGALPVAASECGITVDAGSTKDGWITALRTALDPARAAAMSAAGRRFAATLDWDTAAGRWDREYASVKAARASRPGSTG